MPPAYDSDDGYDVGNEDEDAVTDPVLLQLVMVNDDGDGDV